LIEKRTKGVVLVVEDDMLLREVAAQFLADAGFEVAEASDADEAIEVLESRRDVRLVFTDIDMPGSMDGLKLASAIRDRWPPVEIIVTSGKNDLHKHDLPERGHFIPKPYDLARLLQTVDKLVAQA
jgi:CheY-like chemotaxis protein